MARLIPKKSAAIQAESPSAQESQPPAPPEAEPSRLNWGWKLAAIVWLLGFGGLALYESIGLLVKLIRR